MDVNFRDRTCNDNFSKQESAQKIGRVVSWAQERIKYIDILEIKEEERNAEESIR